MFRLKTSYIAVSLFISLFFLNVESFINDLINVFEHESIELFGGVHLGDKAHEFFSGEVGSEDEDWFSGGGASRQR